MLALTIGIVVALLMAIGILFALAYHAGYERGWKDRAAQAVGQKALKNLLEQHRSRTVYDWENQP